MLAYIGVAKSVDLHPTKTKIVPLRKGIKFLGYVYRLTDTGKVVMTADPNRLKSTRRKYYRLVQKCKRGEIGREKVDQSYACWRECASKGDGYKMLRKMDAFYANLWKGEQKCLKSSNPLCRLNTLDGSTD